MLNEYLLFLEEYWELMSYTLPVEHDPPIKYTNVLL